ncbi:MAG: nucleotidyl transferase AbiEii/AbiGii toxin family protein [Bacilli bacterium]
MFWNVLDQHRQSVLRQLSMEPPVPDAYLAGGTAVALQIGHRESIDFDFFSPREVQPDDIIRALQSSGVLLTTDIKRGTFHGIWNDVQVTWLHYPFPVIRDCVKAADMPGFQAASLIDIALMKLIAVSQRGARKDFVDLYAIAQHDILLVDLLGLLPSKYPETQINLYHIIKSLIYFEDAEREPELRMLQPISWESVKSYFMDSQRRLLDALH